MKRKNKTKLSNKIKLTTWFWLINKINNYEVQ